MAGELCPWCGDPPDPPGLTDCEECHRETCDACWQLGRCCIDGDREDVEAHADYLASCREDAQDHPL